MKDLNETLGRSINARTPKQFQSMAETVEMGKCPFCPPLEGNSNPPIWKGKYWWIKKSDFPYEHTSLNLIIIYHLHVPPRPTEFDPAAGNDLFDALCWVEENFHPEGYGIGWRLGDLKYNAGTIEHPHMVLAVPDLTGNVKATFAKTKTPEDLVRRALRLMTNEAKSAGIGISASKPVSNKIVRGFVIQADRNHTFLTRGFMWLDYERLPREINVLSTNEALNALENAREWNIKPTRVYKAISVPGYGTVILEELEKK